MPENPSPLLSGIFTLFTDLPVVTYTVKDRKATSIDGIDFELKRSEEGMKHP